MSRKLIAVRGKKGVGKNFVADVMAASSRNNGFEAHVIGWSDPLKDFIADVMGVDRKFLYGNDNDKNTLTEYRWENIPAQWRSRFKGSGNEFMTSREIMQFFGTDVMREMFAPDVWIKATLRRLKDKKGLFIISDTRFENEMAAVRDSGGEVWRVIGEQRGDEFAKGDPHRSEEERWDLPDDFRVHNEQGDTAKDILAKIESRLREVIP